MTEVTLRDPTTRFLIGVIRLSSLEPRSFMRVTNSGPSKANPLRIAGCGCSCKDCVSYIQVLALFVGCMGARRPVGSFDSAAEPQLRGYCTLVQEEDSWKSFTANCL